MLLDKFQEVVSRRNEEVVIILYFCCFVFNKDFFQGKVT